MDVLLLLKLNTKKFTLPGKEKKVKITLSGSLILT